mgnify:CR=1 FL=1
MQYTDDATLEWYLKVNNLSAEDLIEDGPSSERASVLAAMADTSSPGPTPSTCSPRPARSSSSTCRSGS